MAYQTSFENPNALQVFKDSGVDKHVFVGHRTSDSCYVNLPIKLVKIKILIYPQISLVICSSQLLRTGYKFAF